MRLRPASWDVPPKGEASTSLTDGSRSPTSTSRRCLALSEAPVAFSEAPDSAFPFPVADGVCSCFGMCWITSSPVGAQAQTASSANDATINNVECIPKRSYVASIYKYQTVTFPPSIGPYIVNLCWLKILGWLKQYTRIMRIVIFVEQNRRTNHDIYRGAINRRASDCFIISLARVEMLMELQMRQDLIKIKGNKAPISI